MKIGKIAVWAFAFCVLGGFAEAFTLPQAAMRMDQVKTSTSRGIYGFRATKYNKASWGNRWWQTLGRAPVVVSPAIRGY